MKFPCRETPAGDIHPLVIDLGRTTRMACRQGRREPSLRDPLDRKRDELYFALLAMLQGPNVRIKIQRNRKRREEEDIGEEARHFRGSRADP